MWIMISLKGDIMKKKIIVLLLAVTCLIGIKGVKADVVNLRTEYIDNLYHLHYRNGVFWSYGRIPFRYMNGQLSYCVQPDNMINTDTYYTYDDFSVLGYSEEEKKQMELIAYYGYMYPGHESLNYYLATQELIWLFSPDDFVFWDYDGEEYGEQLDVSNEKNEIMRLVNNHNKKPSFYKDIIEVESDSVTLVDDNNVLDNYNIEGNLNIVRDGNKITISSNNIGEYNIKFKKRRELSNRTIAYNNESIWTQKMASFGEPEIEEFDIKLIFNKVNVLINKKDLDTNELIKDENNIIKIKNINSNEYLKINDKEELEFNLGIINISLKEGKYKIEEINSSINYSLNKEGLSFEITSDNLIKKEIDFYNKKTEGKIKITKVDEDNNYLDGTVFEIYDKNNNVVDTIETKNGIAESRVLPLGEYKLLEKKSTYGYEKDDKFYNIDITYEGKEKEIVEKQVEIVNKKILCEIVFISSSNENIIDSSFSIYDTNNNLIYEGKTNGSSASISLPYGDYILKEIEVPNGYKLNNKEINFSVNDNSCSSRFVIDNEKVNMPITTSSSNISYLILLLVNIANYALYKKNY